MSAPGRSRERARTHGVAVGCPRARPGPVPTAVKGGARVSLGPSDSKAHVSSPVPLEGVLVDATILEANLAKSKTTKQTRTFLTLKLHA